MSGIHMTVFVDDKDTNRALQALWWTLSGNSLAKFHKSFTERWLQERASARFMSEGDDASGRWAPLTDSRMDIRENQGYLAWPINEASGDLYDYITKTPGDVTFGANWSAFFFPGNPRNPGERAKLETAQKGRPAGNPMPDGQGGTKPSPSATPARPVAALGAVDMIHTMTALELFIVSGVGEGLAA